MWYSKPIIGFRSDTTVCRNQIIPACHIQVWLSVFLEFADFWMLTGGFDIFNFLLLFLRVELWNLVELKLDRFQVLNFPEILTFCFRVAVLFFSY